MKQPPATSATPSWRFAHEQGPKQTPTPTPTEKERETEKVLNQAMIDKRPRKLQPNSTNTHFFENASHLQAPVWELNVEIARKHNHYFRKMTGTWLRPRLGRPDQMLPHSCALIRNFNIFSPVFANHEHLQRNSLMLPCNLPGHSWKTAKTSTNEQSKESERKKSQTNVTQPRLVP